jgi:EmrB/QacA subfamily drug resistance transporter
MFACMRQFRQLQQNARKSTGSSYRWVVLGIASAAAFMSPFDATVVYLALPTIARSLGGSFAYIIWIPTLYLLASAVLGTTMGRLGDLHGKRNVLLFGAGVFTLGSFLAGVSGNIYQLLADRVIQGVGAAAMEAVGLALIANAFSPERRGRAMGINIMVVYAGTVVGPAAGGFLVESFGWRSIFYVNIPIGIVAVVLGLLFLKSDEVRKAEHGFDISGALTLTVFLSSLLLLLGQADLGLQPWQSLMLDLVCPASFVAFLLVEGKISRDPLLDLGLFAHNRLFSLGMLTSLLTYITSQGSLLLISLYLQLVLGISPIVAGLILLAQPAAMAVSSPLAGFLSDRFSARFLVTLGTLSRAVGFLLLSFIGTNSPVEDVWVPLILIGLGHGLFAPPNTNSVISSVSHEKFGLASGTLGTIRTAGNSIGIAILGAIVAAGLPPGSFAALSGGGGLDATLIGPFVLGTVRALAFAALVSGVAMVASALRGKQTQVETRG